MVLKPRRWYEALPEVVLGVGLTWFLVDQTDAATSAFKSGQAVALMAAGVAGWVVARLALARFVRWLPARMLVLGGAALAVLAVVVVPAYDDDTVVETFPAAVSTAETAAAPAASEPVLLGTGPFRGIDHEASGTVTIHRRADGRYVVGLEDFDIHPGPDYDIYLVPGSDRRDRAGGTRLDDLRGNRGTQFYDVPEELAVGDGPWTVLIWCQTFAVPVAHATPV